LGEDELRNIPSYLVTTYQGIPVMQSDENGCKAYGGSTCQIYPDRPVYCIIFPMRVVAIGREMGIFGNGVLLPTGHGICLSQCYLGININHSQFEELIDPVLQTIREEPELFKRMINLTDKYDIYVAGQLRGFFHELNV
jgi:Fe-S-cluster containining protein